MVLCLLLPKRATLAILNLEDLSKQRAVGTTASHLDIVGTTPLQLERAIQELASRPQWDEPPRIARVTVVAFDWRRWLKAFLRVDDRPVWHESPLGEAGLSRGMGHGSSPPFKFVARHAFNFVRHVMLRR